MQTTVKRPLSHRGERGVSIFVVAAALFVIIGLAGLAIDLASLYVSRSEAQRAADAGALAGAAYFVTSSCTSSTSGCSSVQTQAANEAVGIGTRNLVAGTAPTIDPSSDVTFQWTPVNDPRITVTAHQTVGTLFMRIFGWTSVNVAATATAEAYNPGPNGPSVGTTCVKPWIFPNVDVNHWATVTPPPNACPAAPGTPAPMTTVNWCFPNTSGGMPPNTFYATYVNPQTNQITNPGPNTGANSGGAIGQAAILKSGSPAAAPAPSQWYPIQIPPGQAPVVCPNCNGPGSGPGGASLYAQNIECCNTNIIACGAGVQMDTKTGNMQGPTQAGVQCLVNESNGGQWGNGQDTLCGTSILTTTATCGPPFSYYAGGNNAYASPGQKVTSTPSLITVPVYSGAPLTPGQSTGATTITVLGFIQFFLDGVKPSGGSQGDVLAHVVNISACGSAGGNGGGGGGGGGAGGGVVNGGGASPVPVRLVSQ